MLQKIPPTRNDRLLFVTESSEFYVPATLKEVAIDDYEELTIFEVDANGYRREIYKGRGRRSKQVSRDNEKGRRPVHVSGGTGDEVLPKAQGDVGHHGEKKEAKKLPTDKIPSSDRKESRQQ